MVALVDLNADALSAVAERLVRDGEAFWFAILSRATRAAVRQACERLKLAMASRASTAFVSLARLRIGMELSMLKCVAHANMDAEGLDSRPHSMDHVYTWSPAGERALAASADAAVLDYAWSGWRLSIEPFNPGCFVVKAAGLGRVDLLTEMAKSWVAQGVDHHLCHRVMRVKLYAAGGLRMPVLGPGNSVENRHGYVQMMQPSSARRVIQGLSWAEHAILSPALKHGNHAAIKWYYDYMEAATDDAIAKQAGSLTDMWRTAISREGSSDEPAHSPTHNGSQELMPLQGLASAAAHGADSYASLTFLLTWMWPRLGSRSPYGPDRDRAHKIMCCAVLWSICENVKDQGEQTWQWLQGALPQGAYASLMMLARDVDLHVAPLMENMWKVRNVRVYHWMQARLGPGGWLHELAEKKLLKPTTPAGEEISAHLRLATLTLSCASKRRHEQQKYRYSGLWELDRDLVIAALTDAFCWSWQRPGILAMPSAMGATFESYDHHEPVCPEWHRQFKADTGIYADQVLEHDARALVDVLCGCGTASDPKRILPGYTRAYLEHTYCRKLMEFGSGCTHAMQQRLRKSGWLGGPDTCWPLKAPDGR